MSSICSINVLCLIIVSGSTVKSASPLAPIAKRRANSVGYVFVPHKLPEIRNVGSQSTMRTSMDSTPDGYARNRTSIDSVSPLWEPGGQITSPDYAHHIEFTAQPTLGARRGMGRARYRTDPSVSRFPLNSTSIQNTTPDPSQPRDIISIHMVFIALAVCVIFFSTTIILLIVIICNKHSQNMFIKHSKRLNSVHKESIDNNDNNSADVVPMQVLYQEFQALQTRIVNTLARNSSIQHSNDLCQSATNFQNEYANNPRRLSNVSMNPITSPYQMHAFQSSNNSNCSNSNNLNTEIVLPGTMHMQQQMPVPVDNNLFMEFLEYKRRQSVQQNYLQRQSSQNSRQYQMQCGADGNMSDILERGSSEDLFAPLGEAQATRNNEYITKMQLWSRN